MKNFSEQTDESSLIDRIVLSKLQQDFDVEVLIKIVEDYRSQAQAIIELLMTAYMKNDFELIRVESHRLKGSSISLGATKMAMISGSLELSMRQPSFDQTKREVELLKEHLAPTIFLFKKLCHKNSGQL